MLRRVVMAERGSMQQGAALAIDGLPPGAITCLAVPEKLPE
jgi:hypothetical protein